MEKTSRPIVIAGNWKMYKTISEAVRFIQELAPLIKDSTANVLLAVPFTAIFAAAKAAETTNILIGAQNLNENEEGAFTGEITTKMIKEAGASFVIVGHSERRRWFHETDELVNKKIRRALQSELLPIVCIGETLDQREIGKTEEVLQTQLSHCLSKMIPEEVEKIVIAYEPVWAIGTGRNATPDMAQRAHQFCRNMIAEKWGPETSKKVVIQYGGSVKPENAKALLEQPDIDGLLVGGASLDVDSFSKIIHA